MFSICDTIYLTVMIPLGDLPESSMLRLKGGRVFDSETSSISVGDVVVADGHLRDPAQVYDDEVVVDVGGLVVSPGLVDLHTHVFRGQMMSLDPCAVGPQAGTTTMVDAGSAGGHLFGAFRSGTIDDPAVPRILAFMNVASIGTTSHTLQGELRGLAYCDEGVALDAIEANRDVVIGIKVRASADVAGSDALEALGRARRVADKAGLPLMCHLGPAPASSDDILRQLRAGDILTHCFTGFSDNYVTRDAKSLECLREARDRGVLLDVGHGASGFSLSVAAAALEAGIPPTTISSDLHRVSVSTVVGLPNVLMKFLALGMPLTEVLARATLAPSRVVGADMQGVGTLRPGALADVAVFRIDDGPTDFVDAFGGSVAGSKTLATVLTIQRGRVVFDDGTMAGSAR